MKFIEGRRQRESHIPLLFLFSFLWGENAMKRAAVITDISGLGNCSANANISVLASMGIECCFIPTAVLSAQTGFCDSYIHDMTPYMSEYMKSLKMINPNIDAIYIGFIPNSYQAEIILDFVKYFSTDKTTVIADPIMGDNGKCFGFVNAELCAKIAQIAGAANIITPNLTELCILADKEYSQLNDIADKQKKLSAIADTAKSLLSENVKNIVVTGIELDDRQIANLCVDKDGGSSFVSEKFGGSYSGTGDIFTSVVCGSVIQGESVGSAVQKAVNFISMVLKERYPEITDRNYGIPYQEYLFKL